MTRFGISQINNPVPRNWSNAIEIFTVVDAAVIAWLGTANFIPANTSSIIQSILGLLLVIARGLKPFIGVQQTNNMDGIKPAAPNDVELNNK